MRAAGQWALLLVSVCGLPLLAQNPADTPATAQEPGIINPDNRTALPLTPEQQREQQIRQVDPLDNSEDKDAKAKKDKEARDAPNGAATEQPPTPGSLAAEAKDATRQGPEVTEADAGNEPVQAYTGPAVLSRSYSVNRPLIPQQLKWSESLGVSEAWDSGVTKVIDANGMLSNASLLGTMVDWSFAGRHYFRRDMIAVNYNGNYSQYGGQSSYSGSNNRIAVDYSHVVTNRIQLNVSATGASFSQSYTLENPDLGPDNTIANINLGISPNVQITDYGTKQFSSQASVTWQKSARLSFNGGGALFAITRAGIGLVGTTGSQANGDMNYRLTSRMTVGAYYSLSHYVYTQGFGNSGTNTAGGIFSYGFSKTMQIRLRGGISSVDSVGFQTIPVAPALAVLLGQQAGIIDVSTKTTTSDISAQFIKDFRRGKTATIAFAHGISPGNGLYMTSEQESMSASFATPVFRTYTINFGLGRDTLTAIGQELGNYVADFGRFGLTRRFERGVSADFGVEYRHFDISESIAVRNQLRISSGITWGSTNGRIWPF